MTTAADFLELLWGKEPPGYIQTWQLATRRSTYWKSPVGVNVEGEPDVFTAVCTTARKHGANHRAKADQTAALCGLFLDLDVGAGKFANRNRALSFSWTFARPTILVDSGTGGVHAYWLFERPWVFRTLSERERAKIIVQQWVALNQMAAAEQFVQIDSVGDLARILRLPGSLNTKTDPPGVVTVIEAEGPRHTYSDLARHLTAMPIVEQPAQSATPAATPSPVPVPGDGSQFAAKLEALLANSPEFATVWTHQRTPGDGSLSSYDLSLCSLAARAMNDADLALLIGAHRARWGDLSDQAKGRRASYVDRTIARARSRADLRSGVAHAAAQRMSAMRRKQASP